MSHSKHSIPSTATSPPPKRVKQAATSNIDLPAQLKGVSFKFKSHPNEEGDFERWLHDIIITAFPTAPGKQDEIIIDIKARDKKKTKPFDLEKFFAAWESKDFSALDDEEEEEEEDDEDDEGDEDNEDDPDFDEFGDEDEGFVYARLIERCKIRPTFWRDMEEPSQDTAALGFNIFDRYGCLRSEFINGARKGSGIFGNEMHVGSFVQIEMIRVNESHRRRGLASTMLNILFGHVRSIEINDPLRYALVWPAFLNREMPDGISDAERAKLADEKEAATVNLHRKAGFRRVGDSVWFAYAFDDSHPSRLLATKDDYDPPDPAPAPTELQKLERELERKRTKIDRGMATIVVSDAFRGYPDDQVKKLLELRGISSPTKSQFACAKFGCTCGGCLSGYLSPRMLHLIKTVCEYEYDNDMEDMRSRMFHPESDDQDDEDSLMYPPSWSVLPAIVKPFMKSNKSIRKGHRLLFGHTIKCLDQKLVPTVQNIVASVKNEGEWPPCSKNFIERAGAAGIQSVIRYAIQTSAEKDLKAGCGIDIVAEYEERKAKEEKLKAEGKDPAEGEDKYAWIMRNAAYEEGSYEWELMRKEKECRNDSEFGLLVGMLTGQAFSMDEYWN